MTLGLGTFRFALAFFVAISHLWAGMFGGPAAYAVWGFFVLSGFLMTEILRNKYGFTVQGLQKYAFNRFLRIFPLYYLTFLFGLLSIYILGKYHLDLKALNPQFYLPENIFSWIANITLLPLAGIGGRPVPVSGALAVEVGVYILIPFMAVNRSAAWLGAILSLLASIKYGIDLTTFAPRYSEFLTGYFAFAIGALTNHYKTVLLQIAMPRTSSLIWLGHCLVIGIINTWPWTYGLYVSTFLSAWIVISLYQVKGTPTDTLLGDLSYPVYLFHTTVGAWMLLFFDSSRSFTFFFLSFILTLILSWVLLIIVDRPLQRRKKRAVPDTTHQLTVDEYLARVFGHLRAIITHRMSVKILLLSALIGAIAVTFISYKIYVNHNFKIHAWGPQNTQIHQIPNVQPDGNCGLWIKTGLTVGLGTLKVYANGEPMTTVVSSHLITATLPKELFYHSNRINIEVMRMEKNEHYRVGTLRVDEKQ